jgi:sugar O-acyltransferase (sialic acid O-acetyltransferase NeuD family)
MGNLILVGFGGFGREVYCWFRDYFSFDGVIDDEPKYRDIERMGCRYLGRINEYKASDGDEFVCAIGDTLVREVVISIIKKQKATINFPNLVHPSSVIAHSVELGEGNVICPFVVMGDNVNISDFNIFNFYSSCGHDSIVGDYCTFSPYSTINGFVVLKDNIFLGTHASVLSNRRIGCNVRVNANSVAMSDVKEDTYVYGLNRQKCIYVDN